MRILQELEKEFGKKKLPQFEVGDTIDVHVKIIEGDKERIQIFSGTVIKKKGGGLSQTLTVRRIVQGEGVERIFSVHSPYLTRIVIKKRGKVRRAKLYYLRERLGRATKLEEKVGTTAESASESPEKEKVEKTEIVSTEAS